MANNINYDDFIKDITSNYNKNRRDETDQQHSEFWNKLQNNTVQQKTAAAQNVAQNQFSQNLGTTQATALDAIRRSNASAIASGANAGLSAANQLSAILGLQAESVDDATELANRTITDAADTEKFNISQMLEGLSARAVETQARALQDTADTGRYTSVSENLKSTITDIQNKITGTGIYAADGPLDQNSIEYAQAQARLKKLQAGFDSSSREEMELALHGLTEEEVQGVLDTYTANEEIRAAEKQAKEAKTAAEKAEAEAKSLELKTAQAKQDFNANMAAVRGLGLLDLNENGHVYGDGLTKNWKDGEKLTNYYNLVTGELEKPITNYGSYKEYGTRSLPDGTEFVFNKSGETENAAEKRYAEKVQAIYTREINKLIDEGKYNEATEILKMITSERSLEKIAPPGCITGDTLITMANGTQKAIKDIQDGEMVLSHIPTGDVVVPLYTSLKHPKGKRIVLRLHFNNQYVDTVDGHSFLLADSKKCVAITLSNVTKYVGKEFTVGVGRTAILTRAETRSIDEEVYSPMAHKYIWLYTNGVLSAGHLTEFIVNSRLKKYNPKKLIKYNQLPAFIRKEIPEEIFDAFDGEMLKIWARGFKKFTIWRNIKKLTKLLDPK